MTAAAAKGLAAVHVPFTAASDAGITAMGLAPNHDRQDKGCDPRYPDSPRKIREFASDRRFGPRNCKTSTPDSNPGGASNLIKELPTPAGANVGDVNRTLTVHRHVFVRSENQSPAAAWGLAEAR
jgi:hypothetical protein